MGKVLKNERQLRLLQSELDEMIDNIVDPVHPLNNYGAIYLHQACQIIKQQAKVRAILSVHGCT